MPRMLLPSRNQVFLSDRVGRKCMLRDELRPEPLERLVVGSAPGSGGDKYIV